ncbi:hypothetical protein ACWC1D_29245, partial [Streptomyces sp. NPDC001478]
MAGPASRPRTSTRRWARCAPRSRSGPRPWRRTRRSPADRARSGARTSNIPETGRTQRVQIRLVVIQVLVFSLL